MSGTQRLVLPSHPSYSIPSHVQYQHLSCSCYLALQVVDIFKDVMRTPRAVVEGNIGDTPLPV
jgi:hypothetical protein